MTERKWLPSDYQDEVIPPPRNHPNDWIVRLPGDSYGLAPADESEADPRILKDGDIVKFDWTESHGRAEFTVNADRTWLIDRDAPNAPEGGYMMVAIYGDTVDTMMPGLDEFAEAFISNLSDGELPFSDIVTFYSWSSESLEFVFSNGSFQPLKNTSEAEQ